MSECVLVCGLVFSPCTALLPPHLPCPAAGTRTRPPAAPGRLPRAGAGAACPCAWGSTSVHQDGAWGGTSHRPDPHLPLPFLEHSPSPRADGSPEKFSLVTFAVSTMVGSSARSGRCTCAPLRKLRRKSFQESRRCARAGPIAKQGNKQGHKNKAIWLVALFGLWPCFSSKQGHKQGHKKKQGHKQGHKQGNMSLSGTGY